MKPQSPVPMLNRKICYLLFFLILARTPETLWAVSLNGMDIAQMTTVDEVAKAVKQIQAHINPDDRAGLLTFELQKTALEKTGLCISRLAVLNSKDSPGAEKLKVHMTSRDTLKRIIAKNEQIIVFYQENKLDKLENPSAFFKSPQWQHPQYLISLASYWIGWNGYYASLVMDEKDSLRKDVLDEGIKGFSRAFIDFEEEDVTLRSLLGRALCHCQLSAFESARKDLRSVKRRLDKENPLYLRCLYEENRILYDTGNLEMALRGIDEIYEDYPTRKIPPGLAAGFDRLKAKILMTLLDRTPETGPSVEKQPGSVNGQRFAQLRKLSENAGGFMEYYRYVQENAHRFKDLSDAELGPVGCLALGDTCFKKKEYKAALDHYLPLLNGHSKLPDEKLAGVRFRAGYIHCHEKNWPAAVALLKDYHIKYPDSYLLEKAVPLYYAAAGNHYRETRCRTSHEAFLAAVQVYVTQCRGNCPELSDAHFQMGQYYEKRGQTQKAATEFQHVGTDSPNAAIAKYYLLKYYVARLEDLKNTGRIPSEESDRVLEDGRTVADAYRQLFEKGKQPDTVAQIHPKMVILEACLLKFDTTGRCEEIISKLSRFEARFPKEKGQFQKAFQLRATCYAELEKDDALKGEIHRFIAQGPADDVHYNTLKDLANHYFFLAENCRQKQEMGQYKKKATAALAMYDVLYRISCDHATFKNNCDAIQLRMARLLVDDNQLVAAENLYQGIIRRNSLSADAYYGLALLYEKKEAWEPALATWQHFARGVKEGTYHWYLARYKMALCQVSIGQPDKGCEILTVTTVLHPDMGDAELADNYLQLQAKICRKGH